MSRFRIEMFLSKYRQTSESFEAPGDELYRKAGKWAVWSASVIRSHPHILPRPYCRHVRVILITRYLYSTCTAQILVPSDFRIVWGKRWRYRKAGNGNVACWSVSSGCGAPNKRWYKYSTCSIRNCECRCAPLRLLVELVPTRFNYCGDAAWDTCCLLRNGTDDHSNQQVFTFYSLSESFRGVFRTQSIDYRLQLPTSK